jgi:hypothetical protein
VEERINHHLDAYRFEVATLEDTIEDIEEELGKWKGDIRGTIVNFKLNHKLARWEICQYATHTKISWWEAQIYCEAVSNYKMFAVRELYPNNHRCLVFHNKIESANSQIKSIETNLIKFDCVLLYQ